jgi:hypothetical protein
MPRTFGSSERARPITDPLSDTIEDICLSYAEQTCHFVSSVLTGSRILVLLTCADPSIGTASVDNKVIVNGRAADPNGGGIGYSWRFQLSEPRGGRKRGPCRPASVTSIVPLTACASSERLTGPRLLS